MGIFFNYSLDGARDRSSWILLKDRLDNPLVKYSSIFTVFGFFILLGDSFSSYLKLKIDVRGAGYFFPLLEFESRNYLYFFGLASLFVAKLISDQFMPRAIRYFKDAYTYADVRSSQGASLVIGWISDLKNSSDEWPVVSREDEETRLQLNNLLDHYFSMKEYYADPGVEKALRDLFRGMSVLSYQRMSRSRPNIRRLAFTFLVVGFSILSVSMLDVIFAIFERLFY